LRKFVELVLRFRIAILTALILSTAGFGYVITHGVLSTSLISLFYEEDHPDYVRYLERIQRFGNDEVIIVGLESVEPLAPETIVSLRRIHHNLETMADIARVTSLANLSRVTSDGDAVAIKRYADEAFESPSQIPALMEKIRGDPLVRGLFVSQDTSHLLVIVELTPDPRRPAEAGTGLVKAVLNAFAEEGFDNQQVHRTGMLAITAEIVHQSQMNILVLFPVVLIVLLLTVYLLFGRFWPVMITTVVALVSVVWTMGFSILLDPNVHILMSVVPGVVLIIAFSDVIHLCSAYLIELSEGHGKEESILRAGADVGKACLLTSATTGVGFVGLAFIPTPVFRHFGLVLGSGVAIALLLAMTLAPILFSLMKEPKPWRDGNTRKIQGLIDVFLDLAARLSARHPGKILIAFGLFTALCLAGAAQLRFENHFEQRLSANNPVRVAGQFFDANFVGTRTIEVFINTDEAQGLLDPERFHKIVAFRDRLLENEAFERSLSIIDLMAATHDAIVPEDANIAFLPTNAQALHQYLVLLEMDGPDALETFLDFRRSSMRMSIYTRETGIRAHYDLAKQIEALAAEHFGEADGIAVDVAGLRQLLGGFVTEIVSGQRRGLIFSFIAIALLMILGLRSIPAGLWSMLPNLLPLLGLVGLLGWAFDAVDTDTFIIAMIAIGIGVDDTIHFLMRYRIEAARTRDVSLAISRTFHFAGRGIFITTAIFTIGFIPFLMSDYLSIKMFGALLPYCFILALVADFLFLPALVEKKWLKLHA
jgi:uncharacterized protein